MTRPPQPIHFPRIRIKYAEFRYLNYSFSRGSLPWRPDADMGTACNENNDASLGFLRTDQSVLDTTKGLVFYGGDTYFSGKPDTRVPDVSEFGCLTQLSSAHTRTTALYAKKANTDGPVKPLPISVSRIYNYGGSSQTPVQASTLNTATFLLATASLPVSGFHKTATDCCSRHWPCVSRAKKRSQRSRLCGWPGIGPTLQCHPFSGLVNSATDANFLGQGLAVYINKQLLWYLMNI
ncbi:unnamed protein product, partial [Schistocephalus solidus]